MVGKLNEEDKLDGMKMKVKKAKAMVRAELHGVNISSYGQPAEPLTTLMYLGSL